MLKKYTIFLFIILLSGCAFVHKIDVQQGNVVEEKQLNQLSMGMPREQVRFILGTPLIQDVFHANRWDYYYSMHQNGKLQQHSLITLYFDQDSLVDMKGDDVSKLKQGNSIDSQQNAIEPIL